MPAPAARSSSLNPVLGSLSREAAPPALAHPPAGSGGVARMALLHERDLIADLEPHWVAAIEAATD